jgi:hypothetical protein
MITTGRGVLGSKYGIGSILWHAREPQQERKTAAFRFHDAE